MFQGVVMRKQFAFFLAEATIGYLLNLGLWQK